MEDRVEMVGTESLIIPGLLGVFDLTRSGGVTKVDTPVVREDTKFDAKEEEEAEEEEREEDEEEDAEDDAEELDCP